MRKLQLKRFNIIFDNRLIAIENLKRQKANLKDGEPILAAFRSEEYENGVGYVIGLKIVKPNEGVDELFILDIEDILSRIKYDTELSLESNNAVENSAITKVIQDNELVISAALNDLNSRLTILEEADYDYDYVKDITLNTASTYTTATTDTYTVDKNLSEDELLRLKFTPVSDDNTKVLVGIGDIEPGTTAAELKQYTLSKILDDIIFKTVYPTLVQTQSVTFTRSKNKSDNTTTQDLYELGETITATVKYNNSIAQVKSDGGDQPQTAYTKANADSIKLTCNNTTLAEVANTNTVSASYTFSGTGQHSFAWSAATSNGGTLHDSKGNVGEGGKIQMYSSTTATATTLYNNPSLNSTLVNNKLVKCSVPIYVNSGTSTSTQVTKALPLKDLNSEQTWLEVPVYGVAIGGKELIIEVPSGKALLEVRVWNPMKPSTAATSYDTVLYDSSRQQSDPLSQSMKVVGTTTHTFGGRYDVTYNVYKSQAGVEFLGDFKYLIRVR